MSFWYYVLAGYLLVINLIAFIMYGADKRKAKRGARRTPEKTLLGVAFIGGSLGALAGMLVFRHKTKHMQFCVLVPLFLALHLVALWFIIFRVKPAACGRF